MQIYYFSTSKDKRPVFEYIQKQDVFTREKIFQIIKDFEKFGFLLPRPHLKKMAGTQSLWELRIRTDRQFRILVAKVGKNEAVFLHMFIKKQQKTPENEIQTTEKRLKKLLSL